jgi:NADP-dependent 3-hydroxy acid dehydrogenase YdfG
MTKDQKPGDDLGFPALKDSDLAQAVKFLLMTDYSVNLTEITIRPTGESF